MTQDALNAQDIADFLSTRSDFFEQHADLFANLSVPHPHRARAISLGERQILTLRERGRAQELRLAELLRNAEGNQRIHRAVMQWCARMLAEADAAHLPAHIVRSLGDLFDLSALALRVWGLPALADSEFAEDVTPAVRDYAAGLDGPYCGSPQPDQAITAWLGSPPASLAIMALRPLGATAPVGLLVLGSDDAQRFTPDMGTDFLETIAELAGAALGRLAAPSPDAA